MSEEKPWEAESLKGEYYKTKKRFAEMRAMPEKGTKKPSPAKPPAATDAWGKAAALTNRNKKIAKSLGGWSEEK